MITGKENYLLWTTTGTGGIIGKAGAYGTYATQSYQISFTISLGRNDSDPLIPLSLYARDDANGRHYSNIFMTDVAGNAYLGNGGYKTKIGALASSGVTSFRFVLDFEKGKVTAYDENGAVIVTKDMQSLGISLPSGCANYKSWYESMKTGSSSMMSLKGGGAGSIRVYGISMLAGNLTGSCKHFGPQSTLHAWDEGVLTQAPSETNCTPGSIVYTCSECEMTMTVPISSSNPHSSMTQGLTSSGKLEYTCTDCGCTFIPAVSTYLDGSSYDGIVGVGNATNYDTKAGTNQPKINAGAYELINKTGNSGNIELWVPGRTPVASGFSSTENAIGFVSFKVNALTTDAYSFNFVDTSSGGTKWTSDWCITDSFFRIFAPTTIGGKTTVKITGWDSVELASIEVASAQNFTDWIDVKIYVEFNADTDEIIISYYINGEYKCSVSRELTISTNAINSFCITGSTSSKGSGIKLDDVAFGYTANGAWEISQ
jgi:hypothetical protein